MLPRFSVMILTFVLAGSLTTRAGAQDERRKLGPAGRGGGGEFADKELPKDARVIGVKVRHGLLVDGVELLYKTSDNKNGSLGWHGGFGGDADSFLLDEDEYLIGISGRTGDNVDSICFITNKRSSRIFGRNGGDKAYEFKWLGEEIVGFHGHSGQYIGQIGVFLRKARNGHELIAQHAVELARNGKFEQALEHLNEAIRLSPKFAAAHEEIAKIYATCPRPNLRDGKKAVEHAAKAVEFDNGPSGCRTTLAAALAALGHFSQAMDWQMAAILQSRAKGESIADGRMRLELYMQQKPYRQSAAAAEITKRFDDQLKLPSIRRLPTDGSLGPSGIEFKPSFGTVMLQTGFVPDPFTKELMAGGPNETRDGGVRAFISKDPELIFYYTAGKQPLTIYAESKSDTTLLIRTPDGKWVANDDGPGTGLNPLIRFDRPQSGRYVIWVGTFGSINRVPAVLKISELKAGQ